MAKHAKMIAKCVKQKVYSEVFCITFFVFRTPFFTFHILRHFVAGLALARKVKVLRGLFFRGISKAQNSHETRKVYSECFVFHGVFRENIRKIPAKCEI